MAKLNPNIVLLGIVSFLNDVSSEMIFPILPLFITSVLGAPAAVVGLIEGVAEATANVLKMFSGWLSDKTGKRKPFVVAGYSLSAITKPFFAIASSWPAVLAVRFVDRVGKGVRVTARDVIVVQYSTKKNRGYAFGFRKAMDSVGAFVGPLLAAALLASLFAFTPLNDAYRGVFWLAAIPAFASIVVLYFVREKKEKTRDHPLRNAVQKMRVDFSLLNSNKAFRANLLIAFLFGLANFSYAFLVLRAQDVIAAAAFSVLAYAFYNAVYAFAAIPAGRLSDKIGRPKVIALGYALFGVTCLGFGLASSDALIWVFFGFYGVFMAIFESVQRAFVSELVKPGMRGTALGTYQFAVGVSALPASIIAGILWDFKIGAVHATFFYGAVLAFSAAVLALKFLDHKK
ncbi:MAG: MFS transporter [Candidatus Micrarchaeia archaeon]